METTTETLECIDNPDDCSGPVEYFAVPGGNAFPRCAAHADARLRRWEDSDLERYADSDVAPAWFHAGWGGENEYGERWDDDY